MIIREELHPNDKLTEEQLAMLEALQDRPVTPDEDCPELTDEQLSKLRSVSDIKREILKNKKVKTKLSLNGVMQIYGITESEIENVGGIEIE